MPKKSARKARTVKKVARKTGGASSSASTFSPEQIKVGLIILGVLLLLVALPLGLIVLAAVAIHHFFIKK
jgi:hypothetical protein